MTKHDIRLTRLQQLIDERHGGNTAAFADFIGKKRPQIYRLFSEGKSQRNVGEDLAREIEQKHDLPIGWMDAADQTPTSGAGFLDRLIALQKGYLALAEPERQMIDTYLREHPMLSEALKANTPDKGQGRR